MWRWEVLWIRPKSGIYYFCSCDTHSSIIAWRIPWTEEPGGLLVHGVTKSQTHLSDFYFPLWKCTFGVPTVTGVGKCFLVEGTLELLG